VGEKGKTSDASVFVFFCLRLELSSELSFAKRKRDWERNSLGSPFGTDSIQSNHLTSTPSGSPTFSRASCCMAFITGLVSTRSMVVMALERIGKDLKVWKMDVQKLESVEDLFGERKERRKAKSSSAKRKRNKTNPQDISHERPSTRSKFE